jgi:hypothetical protein
MFVTYSKNSQIKIDLALQQKPENFFDSKEKSFIASANGLKMENAYLCKQVF